MIEIFLLDDDLSDKLLRLKAKVLRVTLKARQTKQMPKNIKKKRKVPAVMLSNNGQIYGKTIFIHRGISPLVKSEVKEPEDESDMKTTSPIVKTSEKIVVTMFLFFIFAVKRLIKKPKAFPISIINDGNKNKEIMQ